MADFTAFPITKVDFQTARIIPYSNWFNVKDYGAVGDDAADDTTAIQNAINAAVASNGVSTVFFPTGTYLVNGALQGTLGAPSAFSRLRIPPSTMDSDQWRSITFLGESAPPLIFGTVESIVMPNQGVIIKSTAAGPGAILGLEPTLWFAVLLNSTTLYVENIVFRTTDNPTMSGIDARYAFQFQTRNVQADTGVYAVDASQPTHASAVGIYCPMVSNAGNIRLENTSASGYYDGYIFSEHTTGDNLWASACLHGFVFDQQAVHALQFGRLASNRCPYPLFFKGGAHAIIDQLDFEDSTTGWTAMVAHLWEDGPGNAEINLLSWWGSKVGGANVDYLTLARNTSGLGWTMFKGSRIAGKLGKKVFGEILASPTSQSIGNASLVLVNWNFEYASNYGIIWASSPNPERIAVKIPGIYQINAALTFAANGTGERAIIITRSSDNTKIGGATVQAHGTESTTVTCSVSTFLGADEYITITAYQTSGGALALANQDFWGPKVSIMKVD